MSEEYDRIDCRVDAMQSIPQRTGLSCTNKHFVSFDRRERNERISTTYIEMIHHILPALLHDELRAAHLHDGIGLIVEHVGQPDLGAAADPASRLGARRNRVSL